MGIAAIGWGTAEGCAVFSPVVILNKAARNRAAQ
jgi:hypothetical protein